MADGFLGIRGNAVNRSDWTVLCFVQNDDAPVIYQLGPGMQSPSTTDVDFVKALPPGTLDPSSDGSGSGLSVWFKINSLQTATITGNFPNVLLDISLWVTHRATQYTDDQIVAAAGQTGTIDQFMNTQNGWGTLIPAPVEPDLNDFPGYP